MVPVQVLLEFGFLVDQVVDTCYPVVSISSLNNWRKSPVSAFGIASTVEMGWLRLIMYNIVPGKSYRCQFANMADNVVAFLEFSS